MGPLAELTMLLAHGNNADDLAAAFIVLLVLLGICALALLGSKRDKRKHDRDSDSDS